MDIKDLHITINRSKKVKNLNLYVLPPDGRVEVSAPEDIDDSDIRAFVISKWTMIKAKQREMLAVARQNRRTYETGESHYFFGYRYRLRVEEQTGVPHSVRVDGQDLVMTVRPGTAERNRGELLWEFYRTELKEVLTAMVAAKMKEYGEEDVTWEIKRMRTEWGSCMINRRHLLFNLELARLSLDSIEYIVVHELTHLQEKNHTDKFRALMDKRFPHWENVQKEMNSFVSTDYPYTPDWIAEVSRMASVANESTIANLSVTRAFLAVCQHSGVKDENFILTTENKQLEEQFAAVCPLTDITLSVAIGYCYDTEFYINLGDNLAIKSIWVSALSDSEYLQKVVKHTDAALHRLEEEYKKSASTVEVIDDDDTDHKDARYTRDGKELIRVPKNVKEFEIPNGVRIIRSGAFANCKELHSVSIPPSVIRIETGAFRNCASLNTLNVPLTVMKVGVEAFKNSGLDAQYVADIYLQQGYYTPAVIDSLPSNNVFVYAGKEDKEIAKEQFGSSNEKRLGRNGQSYALATGVSYEEYETSVSQFIAYAKDNENLRFVVRESAFANGEDLNQIIEFWAEAYNLDNVILPYKYYQLIDEYVNCKVRIDSVAKYRFGGVINFSYVVNAISVSQDQKENERIQKAITSYNLENAKEMLLPLCKRYNTGMSIHPNAGLYIGEDDQYYDEGSFEVRIIGVRSEQLKRIATEICSIFVQESVLVRDEVKNEIYFLYSPVMNVGKHPALAKKK